MPQLVSLLQSRQHSRLVHVIQMPCVGSAGSDALAHWFPAIVNLAQRFRGIKHTEASDRTKVMRIADPSLTTSRGTRRLARISRRTRRSTYVAPSHRFSMLA